jgi:hypothetical protein
MRIIGVDKEGEERDIAAATLNEKRGNTVTGE